jgi:hypothetical protein
MVDFFFEEFSTISPTNIPLGGEAVTETPSPTVTILPVDQLCPRHKKGIFGVTESDSKFGTEASLPMARSWNDASPASTG